VKRWTFVAFAILSAVIAAAARTSTSARHHQRSAKPLTPSESSTGGFDSAHAAALFVGIRTFDRSAMREIPYAVDDAIDLAYLFAFDRRVRLVPPERIVLALSGAADKPESRIRLNELVHAGAHVAKAGHREILALVGQQAALAGRNGFLIVSFATHGYVRDGIQYIAAASSHTVSTAAVLDAIAEHGVPRSLILVDACKERIAGRRGRGIDAFSVAGTPLTKQMPRIHGQVVLSTVGAAYDNPVRRNGVFTASVIEGLQCKATTIRDRVTASTLNTYVERNVRKWIRANVDSSIGSATQISLDGEAKNMPLANCAVPPPPPITVERHEKTLRTFFKRPRKLLWQRDVEATITHTAQADGTILAGTRTALIAFDILGTRIWSVAGPAPLRDLTAGDLFRKHNHSFVALWGSQIAIYDADGTRGDTCESPEKLRHVEIYQTTTSHAPRIVVAGVNRVLVYDPKKLNKGKPAWSGHLLPRSEIIATLRAVDHNHDGKEEIAITTTSGATLYVDGRGVIVGPAKRTPRWKIDARK
jgi:hypothetical protein